MIIKHKLDIDLSQSGCDPIIQLSQGDVGSHEILFQITENRRRWRPPAGLSVLVHYSNSFHSGGTYDTLPDGSPAWKLGKDFLSITLVPEMMALPGSVHVTVTLLHGGKALSAIHLLLMVKGLASATSPVLTNYSNITGFLPAPNSAEKGQVFAAEEITESGKVASVTAMDADDIWETVSPDLLPSAKVQEVEEGAVITLSDKDGITTATVLHGKNGVPGTDGKSAYEYALQGGYTGTEEAFAYKLAAEGYGYVAQPEPPEDRNLLWLDTDDNSEEQTFAQADWNASEGQPGYVQNRTHYSEYEERVLMAETAVDFTEENDYSHIIEGNLTVGFRYRVKWNNVEYVCVCKYGGEEIPAYIGEEALLGGDGYTGEPFFAASIDGMIMLIPVSDDIHATVDIVEIVETIHKLPRKYLPAESYVIRDITKNGDIYVVNESYDHFAEILYHGGQVWVEAGSNDYFMQRVLICFATLNENGMIMQGYLNGAPVFFSATNGSWSPTQTN